MSAGAGSDTQKRKTIDEAIGRRTDARKKKDFKAADQIRDALLQDEQVELVDLADGRTISRRKV